MELVLFFRKQLEDYRQASGNILYNNNTNDNNDCDNCDNLAKTY